MALDGLRKRAEHADCCKFLCFADIHMNKIVCDGNTIDSKNDMPNNNKNVQQTE